MKTLSPNWFAEGLIDFEYKQYTLLAYLLEVKNYFEQSKLYPAFSEVIFHYQNLHEYQQAKQSFNNRFTQRLTHFDFDRLQAVYEPTEKDENTELHEIDQIVAYSLPQFQFPLNQGKEIYEYVDQNLYIEPVGLSPLYKNEGYVFIHYPSGSDTYIYQYDISYFYHGPEKLRGVHTHYVTTYQYGLANTYEAMKIDLMRHNQQLPNPATYLVESHALMPLEETVLPVAKRKLLALVG